MAAAATHLSEQVVAEGGHELGGAAAGDALVAEALERLLEGLVEQGAVAEAVPHILQVLVVQLNDCADVLLRVGVSLIPCLLSCERSNAVSRNIM